MRNICVFCDDENVQKRIIVENELAFAFPSNQPIVIGHVLVVPKRCISNFENLTNIEKMAIFELTDKLKLSMTQTFGCKGFNFAWNEGQIAGQTVNHFHLHILPRKEGDKGVYNYEPRKFLYRPGNRQVSRQKELENIARLIKENILII
jgi:histidine triad (HIT) family protein